MSVFTWDDDEDGGSPLCPICGAYDTRSCEARDEHGGECPWELMSDDPDARADDRGCFDYHQRAA